MSTLSDNPQNSTDHPHLMIRASAGTGKTFQLTNRYLSLLFEGVDPSTILASTFTRKAAGEISQRVLLRLAEAALDLNAHSDLKIHLSNTPSQERLLPLLEKLFTHLHGLQISTLDAHFSKSARNFCLELGLSPNWKIIDEIELSQLHTRALLELLRQEEERLPTLFHLLFKGEASRELTGELLLLVKSLHELYLITDEKTWHPFPRPKGLSSDELLNATKRFLQFPLEEIPKHKKILEGHEEAQVAVRTGQWDLLLEKGIGKKVAAGETTYYNKDLSDDLIEIYVPLIKQARANFLNRLYEQTVATYSFLDQYNALYQKQKAEIKGLTFTEVTYLLAEASHQQRLPSSTYRSGAPLEHLLLDEFQDTSTAQWSILRPMAQEIVSGTTQQSFFCVGDTKQAIYGWRGGVAEIFDQLEEELTSLDSKELTCSYRSSPVIMDVVNQVFENLNHLDQFSLTGDYHQIYKQWQKKFTHHKSAKENLAGFVQIETADKPNSDISAQNTKQSLWEATADRVEQIHQNAPHKTIGILVRTNSAIKEIIYELQRRGIRASEEGGNPLTDSPAVEILLSLCHFADHPGDLATCYHLFRSPLQNELGLTDYQDKTKNRQIAAQLRKELLQKGYGGMLTSWIEKLAPNCGKRDLSRLRQLLAFAHTYQKNATLRGDDFCNYIQNQRVPDPTDDRIRVMTIHKSKGLEFDAVVLPELTAPLAGMPQRNKYTLMRSHPAAPIESVIRYASQTTQAFLPPKWQEAFARTQAENVNESLCTLYVAMTRAAQALYLIMPPQEKSLGETKTFDYSRLLRATLTDGSPFMENSIPYQIGHPTWYEESPPMISKATTAEPMNLAPRTPLLPKGTLGRRRGWETIQPSELAGGNQRTIEQICRSQTSTAQRRGETFHKWFEQISWLEEGIPSKEELRLLGLEIFGDQPGILEEWLTTFEQIVMSSSLKSILSREDYLETGLPFSKPIVDRIHQAKAEGTLSLQVANEYRFACRQNYQLVSGSIDRLVLFLLTDKERETEEYLAADILDYKTDQLNETAQPSEGASLSSPFEQAAKEKGEYYAPQLAAYTETVRSMTSLAPEAIGSRLLFVQHGLLYTYSH
ncbi:MAG: UvrD-helicase domain-containing protein [Pirellulaceae bacterium]|nr:UvrD-helicase domain-containing protein [Pirellulaceae bacterium]